MTQLKKRNYDIILVLLNRKIISNVTYLHAINNFDNSRRRFEMVRDNRVKAEEVLENKWRSLKRAMIFDLIEDRGLKPAFAIKRSRTMFSYLVNNFRDQFYFFIVKR